MDRIAIVGLGPIGASLALALRKSGLSDTKIVGTDGSRERLSAASKAEVVDDTTRNVRSAVEGARLVIITSPITEFREILRAIGPNLDKEAVVTETGSNKVQALQSAEELLPERIGFVAGRPLLKRAPDDAAGPDGSIFHGIDYCLVPGRSAPPSSVSVVTSMVEAIGARPLFLDPHEHDSYAAAMSHLPMVLSSAFVTATSDSNGWREMHKVASTEFATLSDLSSDDPVDTEATIRANPEALVHWIDQMIAELRTYRDEITSDGTELLDRLIRAWENQARWEAGTVVPDDGPGLHSTGVTLASTMLGERLANRYREITSGDEKKSDPWKYKRKR
ncbi:MAG: prephenate dehydrogenase [Chloroflexi bacterium]|nr:prephenate dehydrogenase [Chloroflexota bacterium]